ncbi:MAG: hypoxanthine phosphoribosyltransferase [Chloroflexi bacterium]|uniref:Hypoxanthine phosphoribosyltransferase n=1 Tax=Candidatus Thermofonsia Clade 3 bacterium TaxID=2364212 RepID=A0A2M8QDG6_9CHLR|nr:MAG: hypoxanthine phosphoribosyltransferase [Candidatus Thermofonsia Clade 3 bacterium]RMG63582.1 MAG: hypoxanthine phosphoribosyltransferase [Chloroflexota bacterium]
MTSGIKRVLFTESQIAARVAELGAQISRDYAGKDLLLVGILRGGVVFLADLMRCITIPCSLDFMAVTSYGVGARESNRSPRIMLDLREDILGRNVLLIEDIVDSGYTFDHLLQLLRTREPASLKVCALLNKPARREVQVPIDYLGFEIPDVYVCGYGIDADERYRNLPYIAAV